MKHISSLNLNAQGLSVAADINQFKGNEVMPQAFKGLLILLIHQKTRGMFYEIHAGICEMRTLQQASNYHVESQHVLSYMM